MFDCSTNFMSQDTLTVVTIKMRRSKLTKKIKIKNIFESATEMQIKLREKAFGRKSVVQRIAKTKAVINLREKHGKTSSVGSTDREEKGKWERKLIMVLTGSLTFEISWQDKREMA